MIVQRRTALPLGRMTTRARPRTCPAACFAKSPGSADRECRAPASLPRAEWRASRWQSQALIHGRQETGLKLGSCSLITFRASLGNKPSAANAARPVLSIGTVRCRGQGFFFLKGWGLRSEGLAAEMLVSCLGCRGRVLCSLHPSRPCPFSSPPAAVSRLSFVCF